ncbi:dTDP-4-dehydrorhamnose reductase [Candidatus Marinamargulisbacteria bacterium SCGC AG-343-D04]|nr:dTDP-4-dehydrorhamnose reductase [Candidatus Marinamargulisbacteria bacterium SCGC AG-343-D04]
MIPSLSMTIILFGASGMLGSDIEKYLTKKNISIISLDSTSCDITDKNKVLSIIAEYPKSSIVINCAAYTNVDKAETDKKQAKRINTIGAQHIAEACKLHHKTLIHFSTDYVFNGNKTDPYIESDPPSPISHYGHTKYEAEQVIQSICTKYYIIRVQWLYGKNGQHFIKSMKRLFKQHESLRIVNDQWGSPTSTASLAQYIHTFITKKPSYGVYHCRNDGYTTWYDFAVFLAQQFQYKGSITPIPSTQFPRPAKRPLNGRLNIDKITQTLQIKPIPWKEAVLRYINSAK